MITNHTLEALRVRHTVLLRAYLRLQKEDRWTRMYMARDSRSRAVKPTSPEAVCWCLRGAVALEVHKLPKLSWNDRQRIEASVTRLLAREVMLKLKERGEAQSWMRGTHETFIVGFFNDAPHTSHGDVLDVINAANNRVQFWCGFVQGFCQPWTLLWR